MALCDYCFLSSSTIRRRHRLVRPKNCNHETGMEKTSVCIVWKLEWLPNTKFVRAFTQGNTQGVANVGLWDAKVGDAEKRRVTLAWRGGKACARCVV